MRATSHSALFTVMERAARKAGRQLARDFGEVENLQVSVKSPSDFVSTADLASERTIRAELERSRPGFSFLMEEGGVVTGKDPDHVWIIDPLDGTHNFMHGIPHWSISIALEQRGAIVAGIVYDCTKDEMFRAEKGTGAWLRNKRLRVSGRNNLEQCMVNYGQPVKNKEAIDLFYKELRAVQDVTMVRRMASAALDMTYVAAGRIDAYWERGVKPWDVAAGCLIVKEAGGFVTSIENDDNPVHSGNLVAGNPQVHSDIRKILKSV
jgi:myo-inositol-1(or 4)-monophosphatase